MTFANPQLKTKNKKPFVQTKLTIGQPGDKYEQEADAMADQVMKMPQSDGPIQRKCEDCEEESLQMKPLAASISPIIQREPMEEEEEMVQMKSESGNSTASAGLSSQLNQSKGGGSGLSDSTNQQMSTAFGTDFSGVRIHTDSNAVQMNRSLGARAFTHGSDVYFNKGEYNPESGSGKHLLAHELTHVVQQRGGIQAKIQMARLRDFVDNSVATNDPGQLSDSQIEATREFQSFMDSVNIWQWKDHVTREEALLTCRLILRHIQEGNAFSWDTGARIFLNRAKEQRGTLAAAEGFEGTLDWSPFSTGAAIADPSLLPTEFGKWLLAGGPQPASSISVMNCWEMIMFSAFSGGFITEQRMKDIYNLGVANAAAGITTSVGDTVESELRASAEYTLDMGDPDSPQPLEGDMIIFNRAATHAAISLGTVNAAGEHEIISLWNFDGSHPTVERTTIEALVRVNPAGNVPVKFWSVKW